MIRRQAALIAWLLASAVCTAIAGPLPAHASGAKREAERLDRLPPILADRRGHIDDSGRKEKGRASYYARRFAHRRMADGRRLDPDMNVAASKTLPFGSVVKVTNLENGRTTMVQIEDRGPYVRGRVVDLAPRPANQLGIRHQGVVPVVVKPITLPRPDGSVVLGAGAAEATPQEVRRAVQVTRELVARKTA